VKITLVPVAAGLAVATGLALVGAPATVAVPAAPVPPLPASSAAQVRVLPAWTLPVATIPAVARDTSGGRATGRLPSVA
jgi:hypothetical protein